jgi:hypothetical protein
LNKWILDSILKRANVHVVGCAEGYYSCGIKKISPNSTVFAYDINPTARELCRKLAKINEIQLEIRSNFNPSEVNLTESFVLMDVEGYEEDLILGKNKVHYSKAVVMVEVHDNIFGRGCVSRKIIEQYSESHYIELIPHHDSGMVDDEVRSYLGLEVEDAKILSEEMRAGKNCWVLLTPRN